ncbi:sodium-type flagellar motor component [Salinisphaera shabanensis T35B1]|uniref:tetratricopeptide repeat protein n=1 Tax=Salinisphaera shabanensis TaxID=180542 RepID=UPI00333EE2B4
MRHAIAITAGIAGLAVVSTTAASYYRLGYSAQRLVDTAYQVESTTASTHDPRPDLYWPPFEPVYGPLMHMLANAGIARAQTVMGARAQYGDPKNMAVMIERYRDAAAQGYGPAKLLLGQIYDPYLDNGAMADWTYTREGEVIARDGVRIKKHNARAYQLYEQSWNAGVTMAGLRLANLSMKEVRMADDNIDKAAQWYERAARQGNARAAAELGGLYEIGYGVPESKSESRKWLTRAAEGGDTEAAYTLGSSMVNSKPVWRDYDEGARWLEKAAHDGYSSAQISLAWLYLNGTGVPRDYIRSYAWASLGATASTENRLRDKIESRMTSDQVTRAQDLSRELAERIANP